MAIGTKKTIITQIYRGNDGSALYLRKVGSTVYGFGEHPGKNYAYVLHGAVQGNTISAKFWGIPKGTKPDFGTINLVISQFGVKLTKNSGGSLFGVSTWQAITPGTFTWPVKQAAGFQKLKSNDLDGVFEDKDGTRYYICELNKDVVWAAEAPAQPGERPGKVTVFIGKRQDSPKNVNGISFPVDVIGKSADVPKGLTNLAGKAFLKINQDRTLTLNKPNKILKPDYVIDWDIFEKTIRDALDGNGVIGYAYAAKKVWGWGSGQVNGANGLRILDVDGGPKKFTVNTESQALSTTKTITAVALVRALHGRGLTVDAKVVPFLPNCWKKDKSINNLTFRELLDHTSGMSEQSGNDGCQYECLRAFIENGRVGPQTFNYNNVAYSFMRYLIPFIVHENKVRNLFIQEKCNGANGKINRELSILFCDYVLDMLGLADATASFNPKGDFAMLYNIDDKSQKGAAPDDTFFLKTGAGYLSISVTNYLHFLRALVLGELLPEPIVQSMLAGNLGFDPPANGLVGTYYTKNGGVTKNGLSGQAQLMIYPNGVVAYVMANSSVKNPSLKSLLTQAFDNALK